MRRTLTLLFLTLLMLPAAVEAAGVSIGQGRQNRGQGVRKGLDQLGGQNRVPGERRTGPLGLPQGRSRPSPQEQAERQTRRQRNNQLLMQAMGLTADQRTRMQQIRASHEDGIAAAGRRVRQSRAALDRAIMNEQFDEGAIKQKVQDLSDAQVELVKLQSKLRTDIRGVLTSEQVARFNELQRRLRREERERLRQETDRRDNDGNDGGKGDGEELDLLTLVK